MNGTDNMQTSESATVVHTLKLNWWLLALRGLVAVLFGVLAFMWPGATLITLVWLFGAFALVNGVLSLVLAAKTPKGYPKVGSLILGGLLGILSAVSCRSDRYLAHSHRVMRETDAFCYNVGECARRL